MQNVCKKIMNLSDMYIVQIISR